MTAACAGRLILEVPTTRDYLNGGFGDLVAQCTCGAYEYVYSKREGAYWHSLHCSQLATAVQFFLIDSPMPGDWEEVAAPVSIELTGHVAPRTYTCPACGGVGTISAFGPRGGRFYHFGERASCDDCGGSGVTDKWPV